MPLTMFADGRFFGARHGVAPAQVLALHGWGRTHSDFDAVLDGLDAVAIDLPGFGATPTPVQAGGAKMYAEMVESVFDECAAPVVLVGHSFGGRIAVHLAQRRPEQVKALVLTGAPLLHPVNRTGKPALRYRIGRTLYRLHLVGDRHLEGLRDKYGSADYRAAEGVMRDILVTTVNESYEPQMRAITQPVELVWGDGDDAAPPEIATHAETMLADARLTIVTDTGHMLPLTQPGALRAAIDRRLNATS